VYVVTGNGSSKRGKVPAPDAPSFIALHKTTGKLLWQSSLPGANIIEGQWSSPTFASVGGIPQILFPGGDGVLYSFEPQTGKLLWQWACNLEFPRKAGRGTRPYLIATPVVHSERLYVGLGFYPEHSSSLQWSHFLCLDITRKGDSPLVWSHGGSIHPPPAKGRCVHFGRTLSSAAVHDGLVYISEEKGFLHCLDVATGKLQWEHDCKGAVWGSPYLADGKVYLCADDAVLIFEHGRQRKLLGSIDMEEMMQTTPSSAGGVLYVATKSRLYAITSR
jgi:outer membrane protein assembly factor BamB